MELEDSLIMGDENLSTIPKKESDEFIKSSVEDLVPIPSESEDTSDNDSECDFPFCDDSPPLDILGEEIENRDSYVSNFDEPSLRVTPLSDANEDECFDLGGDIDEIDAFLDNDVSTDVDNDHDPRSLKDEPDNDNLKSMVKVFDPGIHEKIISLTNVRFTFEDRHYLSLTYVIRIFLPYLTYSMDSSLPLSSGSEDTIFDPDISAYSFYSLEPVVSHRSGTFMIAQIMKTLVLVVLSIVHSSFNP
ncbi:hypothetical protein Tco_0087017 [Tanacetum coccineum]